MSTDTAAHARSPAGRRGPGGLRTGDRAGAGPLVAWRTRLPGSLDPGEAAALGRLLAATCILGEPRWRDARSGDRAAAVALAIRHARAFGSDTAASDLVMANLLLLAEGGDATAPVVMAYGLRALARRRPGDRCLVRLANEWEGLATGRSRRPR